MAKRQTRNRSAATPQGNARSTDSQLREKGFVPFLRPEHVRNGEQLGLTGFNSIRDRDTAREQFACEVLNEKGEDFLMGIRPGSPDHHKLFKALGDDWRKWRGTVVVELGKGSRGGSFVNVGAVSDGPPDWSDSEPAADTQE